MKLTARLEKLIELTDKCESVADIGTDHGYVPVELIQRGIVKKAYAIDINEKPLQKAKDLANLNSVSSKIEFKLGNGLKPLKDDKVSGVIIAGMGGELIKEIILDSIDIVKGLKFLIMQPAQNPEVIRKFIYSGNFTILSENLVRETDGRFYEYIKVRYNPEVMGFSKNPFDFEISPVLIRHHDPLLSDFIINKIKEIELIKSKLDMSYESSKSKHEELSKKEDKLSEVLKWL